MKKSLEGELVPVSGCHISDGTMSDSENCPVALALKFATGRKNVQVNEDHIVVGRKEYLMPRSVKRFIAKFDNFQPVDSFRFILKEA